MSDNRAKVAGVDELLWPLTKASADPTNLSKLDADGNVLTSTVDVDARYVQKTGDTMTGNLNLERDGTAGANAVAINVYADAGANAVINFRKTRGTKAAQTPLVNNDYVGRLNFNTIDANGSTRTANLNCQVVGTPTATGVETNFSFAVSRPDGTQIIPLTITQNGVTAANVTATNVNAASITANAVTAVGGTATVTANTVNAVAVNASRELSVVGIANFDNGISGVAIEITVDTPSANSVAQGTGINARVDLVTKSANSVVAQNTGKGTDFNSCLTVAALPAGPNNYAFYSQSFAKSFLRGNLGIAYLDPTHVLEVGGDTMLRGPLEVTGNITSNGTAHAFESASIPASAVIGKTPRTIAATGSLGVAGQMVWDENFVYLHTLSGWKKIALSAI
jgi:hypothetical protein